MATSLIRFHWATMGTPVILMSIFLMINEIGCSCLLLNLMVSLWSACAGYLSLKKNWISFSLLIYRSFLLSIFWIWGSRGTWILHSNQIQCVNLFCKGWRPPAGEEEGALRYLLTIFVLLFTVSLKSTWSCVLMWFFRYLLIWGDGQLSPPPPHINRHLVELHLLKRLVFPTI